MVTRTRSTQEQDNQNSVVDRGGPHEALLLAEEFLEEEGILGGAFGWKIGVDKVKIQ